MGAIDVLKGIKRRWRSIAAITVIALLFGAATLVVIPASAGGRVYQATTTMTQNQESPTIAAGKGSSSGARPLPNSSVAAIATLVKIDPILTAVAKRVSYRGTNTSLARRVTAIAQPTTGYLLITARAAKAGDAEKLADAFAAELITYLTNRQTVADNAQATGLQAQINRVQGDIARLGRALARYPGVPPLPARTTSGRQSARTTQQRAASPADPLLAQRDAALTELGNLAAQYQTVKALVADAEGMEIFQHATIATAAPHRIPFPRSAPLRILTALVLGLIAGIALGVLRDRFDRRIRTREAVEDHYGYPVLAEIPSFRKRGRDTTAPGMLRTLPRVADAFRLLGAGLNGQPTNNGSSPTGSPARHPRVILVTSAGPAEGKTSVVASLASTYAEVGKTVMVISADFRHPSLHREFGVANTKGLAEAVRESNGGPVLNGCLWYTKVHGVWLVPSGNRTEAPDQLLASAGMRRAVTEARDRSDVVIIDTSPVLTSDVAFLLSEVDSVLLVAKAGHSKPALAERSSDLLKRLDAPVAGVVLIGDEATSLPRNYYRDRSALERFTDAVDAFPQEVVRAARTLWAGPRRVGRAVKRIMSLAAAGSSGRVRGFPRLSRRPPSE